MLIELPVITRIAAALGVALLISFIATPVVKALAQKMGAVDVPKDDFVHVPIPAGDAAGGYHHRDLGDAG